MKTLYRFLASVPLALLVAGSSLGSPLVIEHLHSLEEIKVAVTTPVYEPIPGVSRREMESELQDLLSDQFRASGLSVSDDASVVFHIDVSYVEIDEELALLVHAQLIESAQLEREWTGDTSSVRVISWRDDRLILSPLEIVIGEVSEASVDLTKAFLDKVKQAKVVLSTRGCQPARSDSTGTSSDEPDY